MSERLEEMLRIARAATKGPWFIGEPDRHGQAVVRDKNIERFTCWHHSVGAIEKEMHANAQHIATFNPRTAEALVKGMQVLEEIQRAASRNTGPLARDNHMDRFHSIGFRAAEALSALTAAMEDSSNVG